MEQTALLAIILMIGFCEWREFKLRSEMARLSEELGRFSVSAYSRMDQMAKKFNEIDKSLTLIVSSVSEQSQRLASNAEFIHKASTDLATIVQEYEVNGIWLGKDRKQQVDAYEG
jgi:methyl-accepting chemotaxis protein